MERTKDRRRRTKAGTAILCLLSSVFCPVFCPQCPGTLYAADVNAAAKSGSTPLHYAANAGMAKLLLEHGADRAVYDAVSYRLFTLGEAGTVLRRLGLLNSGSYELTYTQQDDLFIITMYL